MNPKDIQKKLLQQIHQHIAPVNLADELSELLNITRSGAYRRIKGETLLSLEDLTKILTRYEAVSFEKIVKPNQVAYQFRSLTNPIKSISDYLTIIEQDLQRLTAFPKIFMSYAAQEVPFFHYLLVPEIAVFKLYMWSLTVWHLHPMTYESFDLEACQKDEKLQHQIKRIAHLYASIAGEEIWNSNMFDNTLNQIRHCYLSGRFLKEQDARKMFFLLRGLLQKLNNMITNGHKKYEQTVAPLFVWYNELVQNSTFILIRLSEKNTLVYTVFDAPNFMQSADTTINVYSEAFFDKMKSYALPLNGGVNERNCQLLFNRLSRKLDFFEGELFNAT